MAVGFKEEFTILEWLKIPLDVIEIHQWELQPLYLILAPLIITLLAGFVLFFWRYKNKLTFFGILGTVASLFFLGSGFMILMQTISALYGSANNSLAFVSAIFVLIPFLLGFVLLRKIIGIELEISKRDRIVLVIIGVLGLFFWSGLFLGPLLTVFAAVYPYNKVY